MERIYRSVSDFEKIRSKGAVYVDKTDIIHKLIDDSLDTQFFLSRPRRFGKTLLLSTIKCIFEGKKELFNGLALEKCSWDWQAERCPVLLLDMSSCSGTMKNVKGSTLTALEAISEEIGIELDTSKDLADMFHKLIRDAAAKSPTGKVVVLIDEYDKPLVHHLGTPKVVEFQEFLKRFYGVVKQTGHLQRFALITGVSKFSKVSIFSDLNNLVDITFDSITSTLLGYTYQEVKDNFPQALKALAQSLHIDKDAAFEELKTWYDGYCFDYTMKKVFNPVSLGYALKKSRISSYWFETGTPGWLMSYAKKRPLDVENVILDESSLGTFEPDNPNMTTLLFQTGYLTIKDIISSRRQTRYRLGFPNLEVSDGFNKWLADAYTDTVGNETSVWQDECCVSLDKGDTKGFIDTLHSFFASIGYDLTDRLTEQAYQYVTLAILRFIGLAIDAEVTTHKGRIDMVCKSEEHIFIIEMKVATGKEANEAAAAAAIEQIKERGYTDPYKADAASGRKTVHLIGISFDCNTHNISHSVCEKLEV